MASETEAHVGRSGETKIPEAGVVQGVPRMVLRAEGMVLALAAGTMYQFFHGSWILFILLFLVPDVFMIGYLINKRAGALLYNVGHSTIGPLVLVWAGWFFGTENLYLLGLIWLAHVGFDRLVGYGLKYGDDFKHTHLGTPFVKIRS